MDTTYFLIITIIGLLSVTGVFLYMTIRSHVRPAAKNEDGVITISSSDLKFMSGIQERLEAIIKKYSLDRGLIYQYHNGGKFINGVSMKKYSLTYECVLPGVAKLKEPSQNQFLSIHPYMVKRLSTDDITFTNEKTTEPYLLKRLESLGIDQMIVLPLKNKQNTLIGSLSFHVVDGIREISPEMQKDLIDFSNLLEVEIQK